MSAQLESLEELRVFTQIVESGTLAGAGRSLGMTANTVSRRLAALEQRLGLSLFHRTTRSIAITEAGRTLLGPARTMLDAAALAEAVLDRDQAGLTGTVHIGVPSVLAADALDVLGPLLDANPGLRLDIRLVNRHVNPVAEGLDVLIMGGALVDSTLVARRLTEIALVLAASDRYLEEHGTPTRPEELVEHRMLAFRTATPSTSVTLTDREGAQHVVRVAARVELDDGRALLDAIVAGLGIGAMSRRALRRAPNLQQLLPGHEVSRFPVYAVYPNSGTRSVRVQAVVGALEDRLDW